jgi:hypothetical protein
MLDWMRWTLTHSSVGGVVSVLGLGLLLVGLGVAVVSASSVAFAVLVAAGVLDVEVEADDDDGVSRDGDGEAVRRGLPLWLTDGEDVVGGSLATVEWLAAGLLGDEVDGEGEGDGDGDGDGAGGADDGRA